MKGKSFIPNFSSPRLTEKYARLQNFPLRRRQFGMHMARIRLISLAMSVASQYNQTGLNQKSLIDQNYLNFKADLDLDLFTFFIF